MTTSTVFRSIQQIIEKYKIRLEGFSEAQFTLTPPMRGWSFSEVYSHIFDSNLLSLMAIQRLARGDGEKKPTALAVRLILLFGMLPPGKKYEAPPRLKERVKKISTMAAHQLITDFQLQLAKTYSVLESANPDLKIEHPRLGYLNAKQWLRFIEIHFKHHLKQVERIDKSFS